MKLTFSDCIVVLQKRTGWNRHRVAAELNTTHGTLGRCVNGDQRMVKFGYWEAFALLVAKNGGRVNLQWRGNDFDVRIDWGDL